MTVTFDHTIVHARDNLVSARFLADILGVPGPDGPGHFTPVTTDNGVTLDFMTVGTVSAHHYAFTVTRAQFDAACDRVRSRGLTIYAGPDRSGEGGMYRRGERRGFYFDDPDRNLMELIEVPASEVHNEMRHLATAWAAAETSSDIEALDELLAEEFFGVGPLGFVLDKSAWLARFADGLVNESLAFRGLQVHGHGSNVVVVGVLEQRTTFQGVDSSGRYRVTFVVVRQGGRRQIASCHLGPLDDRAVAS
jgi:catechol 2,3-dioxygenase-like lactoylglutathione lyase family enzyme